MLDLFDYYKTRDSVSYKSILSTFVSESDFWYSNREKFQLKSSHEINSIDRSAIAEMFIEERMRKFNQGIHCKYDVIREVTFDEALQHICQYIDLVIPRHYMVSLREWELGIRIDRTEYRRSYSGISCVPGIKFFYEDNYAREYIKYEAQKAKIQLNKEFSKLNYPYLKFTNAALYRIVIQDAKITGYKLLKDKTELNRLELLRLLHFFYWDRPMKNVEEYIVAVTKDENKVIPKKNERKKNMASKRNGGVMDGLLERGISKLYCKYIGLYDRYEEEVDLILGMSYGLEGVQPCHSGCKGVCESSSGNSLCGGYLGCIPINVEDTRLYIIKCSFGAQCEYHSK